MNPALSPNLISTSPKLRLQLLHKFNLSEEDVQNGVQKILNWFDSQPFLGDNRLDKNHVENLLIQQEGNVERTKYSLLNYFFLKISVPELFMGRDPQLPEIAGALQGLSFCIQYPVSKSGERYICFEFKPTIEKFDIIAFYKLFFMELDMKMRHDYTGQIISIVDVRNFQEEHIKQLDKVIMAKSVFAAQHAYGINFKALHFISESKLAEKWIQLAQTVFEKNNLFVLHQDLDSLHRSVERELLPKNLGGDQDTVDEVQARWLKEANNWRHWFLKEDKKYPAV